MIVLKPATYITAAIDTVFSLDPSLPVCPLAEVVL